MDPTGAGDCFDATFVTCRLQGRTVERASPMPTPAAPGRWHQGPHGGHLHLCRARRSSTSGAKTAAQWPASLVSSAAWLCDLVPPPAAITSVCSAHPMVVEAAMRQAAADGAAVLIEATCNQVNHQGGYTGLTPAAFRDQVYGIADRAGFPRGRWSWAATISAPTRGGTCRPKQRWPKPRPWWPPTSPPGTRRSTSIPAWGARASPSTCQTTGHGRARRPLGGGGRTGRRRRRPRRATSSAPRCRSRAAAVAEIEHLEVTRPEAVAATLEAHRQAFAAAGVPSRLRGGDRRRGPARGRVRRPERRRLPTRACRDRAQRPLAGMPGLVFEAHSTDYQPAESLAQLVADGFAILKVGPGLTFALREALYALDEIATVHWALSWSEHSLVAVMEKEMLAHPGYWQPYYRGDARRPARPPPFQLQRPDPLLLGISRPRNELSERLMDHLSRTSIPEPLISQFLPTLYPRVTSGALEPVPKALVTQLVCDVLRTYAVACGNATALT